MDIRLHDIVRLKKPHPCGSLEWEVLRTGIDFRIRCAGCGHEVMHPHEKLKKRVRRILRGKEEINPNKKNKEE